MNASGSVHALPNSHFSTFLPSSYITSIHFTHSSQHFDTELFLYISLKRMIVHSPAMLFTVHEHAASSDALSSRQASTIRLVWRLDVQGFENRPLGFPHVIHVDLIPWYGQRIEPAFWECIDMADGVATVLRRYKASALRSFLDMTNMGVIFERTQKPLFSGSLKDRHDFIKRSGSLVEVSCFCFRRQTSH